jgi:hypothetical protein
VRTPTELSTVRALGRAAAAVLLLPAVLRRGTGRARRAGTTREFESVSRLADELARTADVEGVARMLLDEIAELFDVGFAALTFVSEDGHEAAGYLARADGEDVDWWPELRLDLEREPSGIASAVFEAPWPAWLRTSLPFTSRFCRFPEASTTSVTTPPGGVGPLHMPTDVGIF